MRTGDPRLAVGLVVGAVFGTVFVVVNSGPPLPVALALVLRVLAVVVLSGVLVAAVRTVRAAGRPTGAGGPRFGRGYLAVVAAELVLLLGGLRLLRAAGVTEEANVAWVALVVGLHFVALAVVWRAPSVAVPGGVLTGLGAAGLAMAAAGEPDAVPFVSGVLSGLTLLAGCAFASTRRAAARPGGQRP